ncbi:type III-B CRISPR module-associated protein Cmr5 [Aceticella autotrophica]|uniref:CRISPR type III-B/RAMP module-associated protein Cmr5 n=1 Tax=Aceticella autotrophica TaxID=2755338 RepID=A0A975AWA5_9THEO|nr:type III-B CRISPR module-associated protein Cmr5 [Aceticella autotrophica]QSZ27588.1 type III-B CRISPR module-associated protein Cmr5 [Aceticella autotrophica]
MFQDTIINKLEKGRAEFAYKSVDEIIELYSNNENIKKGLDNFINNVKNNINKIDNDNQRKNLLKRLEEIFKKPEVYLEKEGYNKLDEEEKARIVDKYKNFIENYRAYSRKIPTMIFTNGLGQTLAFIKAKAEKGNAYELLYLQISEYMKSPHTIRIKMPEDANDLLKWVISCDSPEYRYITQEVLAFLNWLKKFAEGRIEE